MRSKFDLLISGLVRTSRNSSKKKPKSSIVLETYLKNRNLTTWTAFYVPQCDVENDLWGKSHFNFQVKESNYHVLRTGAYPFIKFHCTLRPKEDLTFENHFYNVLKVANFGIPMLLYGIAGLIWANHQETVKIDGFPPITIYFWYRETHDASSPN